MFPDHWDKIKSGQLGYKITGLNEAGINIGKEWMSDTELDSFVPQNLQQEWRELVGYDEDGMTHPLWDTISGGRDPDVGDKQDRVLMVKTANAWFKNHNLPVRFFGVRDADDELDWYVQVQQNSSVKEGTMPKAKKESTGPKFTGYWKGKDKGKPGKKMVGGGP